MVAAAATIKVQEVADQVKREFGDESGAQIRDSDIIRWVNQAQREIVSRNPFNKKTAVTAGIAGTKNYPLPPDVYNVESVAYGNRFLRNINFEEANTELSGYSVNSTSGAPEAWYCYGNIVYLYPVPTKVFDVVVYYVAAPTAVTTLSDFLGVPDRYFNAVAKFCLANAFGLDEDWTAQQVKQTGFDQDMQLLSNVENIQQGAFAVMSDAMYEGGDYDW